VYQNAFDGRTYFKFNFASTSFIGAIKGCDNTAKNYAYLVASIIENSQTAEGEQGYDQRFSAVITGDSTRNRTKRFIEKYSISNASCYLILFRCTEKNVQDVKDFLNSYATNGCDTAVSVDNDFCAYVKFIDNEVDYEYHSATDYAKLIIQAFYEELGYNLSAYVGGKVKNFADVSISYQQAVETMRLSKVFGTSSGIHAYKDFVFVKIIEDLPNSKIKEFLEVLLDENGKQVFNDPEIIETADEFFNNNLNISETARILYIHRNTIMYRIDKIEKCTGLDIRKFGDALTFRIISVLNKLLQ
jgi:carbohydrate diacid regulator